MRGHGALCHTRWAVLQEAWAELKVEAIEATVLWGEVADERVKPLYKCVSELYAAVDVHLTRRDSSGGRQLSRTDVERYRETNEMLFDTGDGNAYTERLDEAVNQLAELVKQHMEP